MACEVSPVAMFCKMVSSESDGHLSQWWWTGVERKLRWPRTPIIPTSSLNGPIWIQSGNYIFTHCDPLKWIWNNPNKSHIPYLWTLVFLNLGGQSANLLKRYSWSPLHYGEIEKWGQKKSTLTNYFSMDIDPKVLHIAPSTPQKHNYLRQIFDKWENNPKNLLDHSALHCNNNYCFPNICTQVPWVKY